VDSNSPYLYHDAFADSPEEVTGISTPWPPDLRTRAMAHGTNGFASWLTDRRPRAIAPGVSPRADWSEQRLPAQAAPRGGILIAE
jgi:hypothetical protein